MKALRILKRVLVSLLWWIAIWFATVVMTGMMLGALLYVTSLRHVPPPNSKNWTDFGTATGCVVGLIGFIFGLCARLPGTRLPKTPHPN